MFRPASFHRFAPPAWPRHAGWLLAAAAGLAMADAARRQLDGIARARADAAAARGAWSRPVGEPLRRVLVLGDSTGVGVGADPGRDSIAALLAREHPQAHVLNLSASGARVADMLAQARQAAAQGPWDLVLVLGGGNDVLQRTPWPALAASADALLATLRGRSGRVVWAGMANVGLAPLFLRPLGWWVSLRTRRAVRLYRAACARQGARFVDFFCEAGEDPFSAEPARYYARDGVHPSAAAYALCWQRLRPAVAGALAQNLV
ncbi:MULTISPECIES: GDSL-type esterase/lipase family protein [Ramlibacter]|uniref:SGNH hydrolase-type esterase domain-containing protein n=1 Tax=Ramlibacter aquaticus TaxID=2780094 RepID=A0ABR9SCJ7_9BURK|nr:MULTISPECIES: GDSL-type esterase/lipase family protein [Ramlibacter]MBE7940075.1 hypothetical protein [Ramlibacter aquaticus]